MIAAASQSRATLRRTKWLLFSAFQCLPDGRGLFVSGIGHNDTLHFFAQKLIGNPTYNKEQFA